MGELNGVAVILAVTSFLLALCMTVSNSMLSAASRQRKTRYCSPAAPHAENFLLFIY